MSTMPSFEIVPICQTATSGNGYRSLNSSDFVTGQRKPLPLVMVVDDDTVVADTLTTILRRNGFAVLTAYDAESALDLARRLPPDLILADCMMNPVMNGVELAMSISDLLPKCKVVLFSGQARTSTLVEQAKRHGHHLTLLQKPMHPADLLARVSGLLALKMSIA